MNKKGFTLVELLAVIVILSLLAILTTTSVTKLVSDAKNDLSTTQIQLIKSAAEAWGADNLNMLPSVGECSYLTLKDLKSYGLLDNTIINPKDNQEISDDLKIKIFTTTSDYGIPITNYEVDSKDIGGCTFIYEPICTANTTKATALVFHRTGDPLLTSSYVEEEVGLLASTDGAYTPGVAYTCNFIDASDENNMTFFVLSSTEDTVTLISGANLGETVAWSEDGNNHKDETEDKQAVTAKEALAERTSNWSSSNGGKLSETQMLTIKLPTAYQIAEAAGQTFNGSFIREFPTWLYSYTKTPLAYGYWTSTPYAGDSSRAWYVYYLGYVDYNDGVGIVSFYGIRPVITISKSMFIK